MSGWLIRPAGLLVALAIAACGTAPTRSAQRDALRDRYYDLDLREPSSERLFGAQTTARASLVGPVSLSVDSALPLVQARTASLFASSLRVGEADSPLSYTASYSLDPGALLDAEKMSGLTAPQELGGQHLGQSVKLQLPAVAGAPLAVDFSHEEQDVWTVTGFSETQRRVAALNWEPWIATVELQWAGAASGIDTELALDCGLRGSLRVPVATAKPGRYRAVRLTGRNCEVTLNTASIAELDAQTYGVAYVWGRPRRETAVRVSVIDPVWNDETVPGLSFDPSYEMAVTQARALGPWTAKALVSFRRTDDGGRPVLDEAALLALGGDVGTHWVTSASLTRQLPAFSISANWARGANPAWFVPNIGQRSDRVGLALDLSRWARELAPNLTPSLAMSWNWTQARSISDITGDNSVKLKMSLMW